MGLRLIMLCSVINFPSFFIEVIAVMVRYGESPRIAIIIAVLIITSVIHIIKVCYCFFPFIYYRNNDSKKLRVKIMIGMCLFQLQYLLEYIWRINTVDYEIYLYYKELYSLEDLDYDTYVENETADSYADERKMMVDEYGNAFFMGFCMFYYFNGIAKKFAERPLGVKP